MSRGDERERMTYAFRLSLGQGLVFLSEMANITSVASSFLPELPPHQRKKEKKERKKKRIQSLLLNNLLFRSQGIRSQATHSQVKHSDQAGR